MRISTSDYTRLKKGSGSNDIFEKCRNFTRPNDLQAAGLYMYFEVFGDRDGCGRGASGSNDLVFEYCAFVALVPHAI